MDQPQRKTRKLTPGTFVRWINPRRGAKPLGIVLSPVGVDLAYVVVADRRGNSDVEIFVARTADTGRVAAEMVLEKMKIVEDPDPELAAILRQHAERVEKELRQ